VEPNDDDDVMLIYKTRCAQTDTQKHITPYWAGSAKGKIEAYWSQL